MKFNSILIAFLTFTSVFTSSSLLAEPKHDTKVRNTQIMPVTPVQVESPPSISKVNVNSATAAELQQALIGIGTKKAEAIIQYREAHGPFSMAEQLLEVQGIGKAILEKNKDRLLF
ncbi:ComEA family DNA-binding protein [Pasteurella oralis]|uniref:ComEA family DNA-binding protein n=1 Tax=Pasteurella oralis TaxID=1071947 RepID=A0ABW4NRE4_9PAST